MKLSTITRAMSDLQKAINEPFDKMTWRHAGWLEAILTDVGFLNRPEFRDENGHFRYNHGDNGRTGIWRTEWRETYPEFILRATQAYVQEELNKLS